ncbi:unnamed protein product [Lota lota]
MSDRSRRWVCCRWAEQAAGRGNIDCEAALAEHTPIPTVAGTPVQRRQQTTNTRWWDTAVQVWDRPRDTQRVRHLLEAKGLPPPGPECPEAFQESGRSWPGCPGNPLQSEGRDAVRFECSKRQRGKQDQAVFIFGLEIPAACSGAHGPGCQGEGRHPEAEGGGGGGTTPMWGQWKNPFFASENGDKAMEGPGARGHASVQSIHHENEGSGNRRWFDWRGHTASRWDVPQGSVRLHPLSIPTHRRPIAC